MEVSVEIVKASKEKGVDPMLYAAILMQESSYRLDARNCTVLCTDFGISQIHISTIRNFNINRQRLLYDLSYSVRMGALILADFKRMYAHREPDWWTRYNTSTPSKRKIYKERVKRWMK